MTTGKRTFSSACFYMAIVALFTITICSISFSAADKQMFTIVAGAESHGMIDACDCEHEPGGGVVKRSMLLKTLGSRKKILLLDAGGFSAGGIYDDYTAGRGSDSLRTIAMIRAMGKMKYDAVAVGDDDLQYGGEWLVNEARKNKLPLISANCYKKDGNRLVKPYILVKKDGVTIGITALTTREQLFDIDPGISVEDPFESLKGIWDKLSAQSDMQILLSHCGQEITEKIAESFDGLECIVNGHRKRDKEVHLVSNGIPILQFGFQGKSLSSANVYYGTNKSVSLEDFRWYDVTPEISEDKKLTKYLFNTNKKNTIKSPSNIYDLYIMSQCPYGLEALSTFVHLSGIDTSFKWNIWFIGTVQDDGTFQSLHGEDEVNDEMLWMTFFELYPDKKRDFLLQRISSSASSIDIMSSLGGDKDKIVTWKNKNGARELEMHYTRSSRLSIDASPTLLVNNRPYDKNLTLVNLQWFHCTTTSVDVKKCGNLPQCSQDNDCKKEGKIGSCDSSGKCTFQDAVPFTFTVLTAGNTFQHPEDQVIGTTRELFPAAAINKIIVQSEAGKKLFASWKPKTLPLYIFDKNVEDTRKFSSVESGLTYRGDAYTFKAGMVPANYFPDRRKQAGKIILFVDPFFKGVSEILPELSSIQKNDNVSILPIIFTAPNKTKRCTEEWFRMEEAQRWLAAAAISQQVQFSYLSSYIKNRGTSFWQSHLENSHITPDSLMSNIAGRNNLIDDHWEKVSSLNIKDPVVVFVNNVETITITGQRMFRRVIDRYLKNQSVK